MDYLIYALHHYDSDGNPIYFAKIAGTSKESKPTTGLVSGSEFLEVDTGKAYVLDAISTTAAWTEKVVATAEVASS